MESFEQLPPNFETLKNALLAQRERLVSEVDPRAESMFLGVGQHVCESCGAGDDLVALGLEHDNVSA